MNFKKIIITSITAVTLSGSFLGSTYANASKWKSGTPKAVHGMWISNYIKIKPYTGSLFNKSFRVFYQRYSGGASKQVSFNFITIFYNKHKKQVDNSSNEGAAEGVKPHYKSLGHRYYKITSGGVSKHSLHDELHNTSKMYGTTRLVKIYNKHKIKVWTYTSHNKKDKGIVLYRDNKN